MDSFSFLGKNPKKENLLASLCKEVGASDYIAAPGSMSYLSKSNAFHDIKVQVRYFNYNHPEYIQLFGNFMPYMSVIDMIFNCSGDKSKELIQNSYHISP